MCLLLRSLPPSPSSSFFHPTISLRFSIRLFRPCTRLRSVTVSFRRFRLRRSGRLSWRFRCDFDCEAPFSSPPLTYLLSIRPSFPFYHPFRPSARPSPDRVPSLGGPGLGAPVIPPSRAGFPLRPRPLEGPGWCGPRSTVPRPRVARAPCSRGAGVIVPASGS